MSIQHIVDQVHACPLDDVAATLPSIISVEPLTLLAMATRIGETGVLPPEEVNEACTTQLSKLTDLEPGSIIESFTKVLLQNHVEVALEWLQLIGFIEEFYPEVEATKHLQQEPGRHHKDVWEHTKLVVKQSVKRPAVRWAALLHDIGKVPTRTFTEKGVHFHGHAEVGARMFDKINRRLPVGNDLRKKIRFLIKYHLRSAQYEEEWSDSAVRRFARDMGTHLVDLLDLSRADITSKRPGRRRERLFQITKLAHRIEALQLEDNKKPQLPKGLGMEIIKHFQVPPSKFLGSLIKTINSRVADGSLKGQQDFEYYLHWLEKSGLLNNIDCGT